MIDTWNPSKLNEKISGRDSWNPAILNEAVTDRDSWNPAILNESSGETPVVFEATITASFPEGATCTATDGTTTLTAVDNPMAFNIPNSGTWAVACVANGVTFSENVVITTNGQTESVDLTPDGETVTPTDSVPMLIACAGIGDSTYTTIADVIADSTLLAEITTNDSTIAYLVRSTNFADSIAADEDAMTAIGASNECSDALLANSTWLNAICNSTYFESVLNVKVPTMTSNTTPEGVCFSSALHGTQAYMAFGAGDVYTNPTVTDNWIGYQFTASHTCKCVKVNAHTPEAPYYCWTYKFKVQGSTDGVTYVDLYEVNGDSTQNKTIALPNNTNQYTYYRLKDIRNESTGANTGYSVINTIQFYGRKDVNI